MKIQAGEIPSGYTTVTEGLSDLRRHSLMLDRAISELASRSRNAAELEVEYRKVYAEALLSASSSTVKEREAEADLSSAKARLDYKIAEALAESAKAAVRAYQAQLSAVQTAISALKAEADFVRMGPRLGP